MPREHSAAWGEGSGTRHEAVLLQSVIEQLRLEPGLVFVDGTLGGASHFLGIAARIAPGGVAIGLDRDATALGRARARIAASELEGISIHLCHAAFGELERVVSELGYGGVDRILLDLGLSSDQLDDSRRGFSFMRDGPLDMRMDTRSGPTAADVVNGLPESDLVGILRDFGEERHARRIAASIVTARKREPIETTGQLAALVATAVPGGPGHAGRSHPATRTFQALRIEVNDELGQLQDGLAQAAEVLKPGGILAVITFHSLEDREVKAALRPFSRHGSASEWFIRRVGDVIRPEREEIARNPRSRSAKLRVYEKVMAR